MKIIVTIILTHLAASLLLSPFLLLTNQKQESGFQKVGGLVMRNISLFYLERVAFYFKAMPNSKDFYKGISLHIIPVRIIVPWLEVR